MMYGSSDMEHDKQNFLSFWTVFCPFTPLWIQKIKILKKWKKHLKILSFYKWVSYMPIIWCIVPEIWSATDRIFCHFAPFFAPLPQKPNNPKNQHLKKMKKRPGDITILHLCTINNDHTVYGSWDMKHDGQNFLPFWTIFCPFTPLTTWKIKISKNWEKHLEIYHFIHVYQKWWSYDVWFLSY